MKRAKTIRKSTKEAVTQSLEFAVYGDNENAHWNFNVEIKKRSIKKWPKIFRGLADLIESGELKKELEREVGIYLTKFPRKS